MRVEAAQELLLIFLRNDNIDYFLAIEIMKAILKHLHELKFDNNELIEKIRFNKHHFRDNIDDEIYFNELKYKLLKKLVRL